MSSATPHIAILGGGVTGLSAAFHLARLHPNARITLLEKQPRLGGWLRSERVEVEDADGHKASILLETGPRTFRANAKPVVELVNLLKLQSHVVTALRSSPAARNRFLHVPPTPGLQVLPSSILSLFTSPLSSLLLGAVVKETFGAANRPEGLQDESVDAFFTRRFGEQFARVMGSALVHGIYGADSRKLSVRAAFPSMWAAEEVGRGSVIWGEMGPPSWWGAEAKLRQESAKNRDDEEGWELGFEDEEWDKTMKNAAVFSFRDGIEELITALVHALEEKPRVELKTGVDVAGASLDSETNLFEIRLANGETVQASHVISALPLPVLSTLLPSPTSVPHLTVNPFATVMVLNLVFAIAHLKEPLHPPGFGYLIPRPEAGYDTQGEGESKTPGILGVVFDTASLAAQDYSVLVEGSSSPADEVKFVKMTAMLGGPYPLSSAEIDVDEVLTQLSVHLGTILPKPVYHKLHRNASSIPTYLPGHLDRVAEMRKVLQEDWSGRLKIIGAGVGGVSMSDCIKAGREAAREIVRQGDFVL
ncbi:Protoporphyrinogen oxidase [Dentipellis sp. KUC8613]|nr:Protoporphyrinogen oxidase [Dentipellis sp. KUC8613]